MSSLKVCHVVHNTDVGGTETMLFQVLQQLAGQHEMSVISLMGCGEVGRRIRELGIPVHAMNFSRGQVPSPGRFVNLVRQVRKLQPDVVQTWAYHADLVGGLAARLSTSAAVVWNIRHATLDPTLDSRNVLRSASLCGRLSRWIPNRILLNAESAMEVHGHAGYDLGKMLVVPNGFDTERFQPSPAQRSALRSELKIGSEIGLVGMCGRFHPHKGQTEFVEIARQLATVEPDVHFLIAGFRCDAANDDLMKRIKQAGLTDRFHLLGSRSDIPAVMNALDVYLLPSRTEGMPNVVGEAMACGTSVVAMDVGDTKRLLGDAGVVVPACDLVAMAEAASTMLNKSADERRAMGARARRRIVEHFGIAKIASHYDSIWREVAENRSSGPTIFKPTAKQASVEPRPRLVHVTTIPMTQSLFLRGQNHYMHQRGFQVHAVSSPGSYLKELQGRDPVTTHAIPISRRIQPWGDMLSAFRLWRLFRQLQPEIVQLSTPKAALLGAIAAKAAGVPVRIYQVRGLSSESETGWKRRVFQQLERLTAWLCNGCLVNANSLLEYAAGAGILKSGYVAGQGMSNGVDLKRFDPAKVGPADLSDWDRSTADTAGTVIGYVGRLTRDKGLEELFQAWSRLRDDFPACKLLLVGPWESENAVSESCRDALDADPRVLFTGTQHDVAPFYRAMDVFAFPSHGTEGFPNAPMEAAAMELPVIATRVVGCVDAVVDNVTGRIISPCSAEELERSLRDYLVSPELRLQHGTAGRKRVQSGFAPETLWADFFDYYSFLLRREGLPVPAPREGDRTIPKAA